MQKLVALPMRPASVHADTPQERIERTVGIELRDLSERAGRALTSIAPDRTSEGALGRARDALQRGASESYFPRRTLEEIARALPAETPSPSTERLRRELDVWIGKHKSLEKRLTWLLDPGITLQNLDNLDPVEDADQLTCWVKFQFRFEFLWAAWANAIERISQVEPVSTFFHATGTAEERPLVRTEDTLIHIYYFLNWGIDSFHGRKAVESMNQMHGRYFIHNDGMKYVLLNGAFSVLDSLKAIGHRPLRDNERLGYFHSHINMGQAMNIRELTHSWDEMYTWFHTVNRAHAHYTPQKIRMWLALEDNFDRGAKVPKPFSVFRRLLEITAMDDTYRSALGFERPSERKIRFCSAVVKGVTRARAFLPQRDPYIESLQNFLTYPRGVDVQDTGEKERSPRMPSACPFAMKRPANHGYPEHQLPLMHARDAVDMNLQVFDWDEVRTHNRADDLWVVFGGHVYDVSAFAKNHPGGLDILLKGAGRDMTKAFENAKHSELTKIFALNFRIGKIAASPSKSPIHPGLPVNAQVQLQ